MIDIADTKTVEFYRSLASALNYNTAHCTISPYAANGDFAVNGAAAGTFDKYFDLANPSFGPIDASAISTYNNKSLLIGNLFLTTYGSGNGGGASMNFSQYLVTGPSSNLVHWFVRRRVALTSDDSVINGYNQSIAPNLVSNAYSDQYYNIPLSLMRLTVVQTGVGTSGAICEYLFNGIRLDF